MPATAGSCRRRGRRAAALTAGRRTWSPRCWPRSRAPAQGGGRQRRGAGVVALAGSSGEGSAAAGHAALAGQGPTAPPSPHLAGRGLEVGRAAAAHGRRAAAAAAGATAGTGALLGVLGGALRCGRGRHGGLTRVGRGLGLGLACALTEGAPARRRSSCPLGHAWGRGGSTAEQGGTARESAGASSRAGAGSAQRPRCLVSPPAPGK